jgi:hypothetical protein
VTNWSHVKLIQREGPCEASVSVTLDVGGFCHPISSPMLGQELEPMSDLTYTPRSVIANSRRRFKEYDDACGEEKEA